MSNPFRIGDYVECVESGDFKSLITVGQVYEVLDVDESYIEVKDSYGRRSCFSYSRFKLYQTTPEQHVKEFLKRLEYVLIHDMTLYGNISHADCRLELDTQVCGITGVDDIYTYINNSYDQLTSQAAQKRKQELLDKKAKLDVELAEINKELEKL